MERSIAKIIKKTKKFIVELKKKVENKKEIDRKIFSNYFIFPFISFLNLMNTYILYLIDNIII